MPDTHLHPVPQTDAAHAEAHAAPAPAAPIAPRQLSLTVNGEPMLALVEPRTHLADFLREQCRLTGTHLGCEHGVCGACTVLIDGVPARSCIAFSMGCQDSDVRTIEGFGDDALMNELRQAFSRHHALQCGFCTPGMLITARDIVLRLPDADDQRIRIELAGNLCRCTGFLGIVEAIKSVIDARKASGAGLTSPAAHAAFAQPFKVFAPQAAEAAPRAASAAPAAAAASVPAASAAEDKGAQHIEDSFLVDHPPAAVWAAFADMPKVAACLPGAEVLEHDARSVKGRINIKFGPMKAAFAGGAALERDDAAMRGLIRGAGNDNLSGSRARGDISYALSPEQGGRSTRVAIRLDYSLRGPLAQFSRPGLVKEFAGRLIAEFARNLNASLDPAKAGAQGRAARLDMGGLFRAWLAQKLRALFGR
jgi:carbon-monoxide dehydrogenase small subunit